MKTILVPTDFSLQARNAAEYAVNLAEKMKAKVILFHAYKVPGPVSEDNSNIEIDPAEIQKEIERSLEKEITYLKKISCTEVTCISKRGLAEDKITKLESHADMIIMGMKSAGILREFFIGSLTTRILRKSKIPVLAIPEKARYKAPERIVFACDYDPKTDIRTLDGLKNFMNAFTPKIFVLNIKQKNETVIAEKITTVKFDNGTDTVEHIFYFQGKKDLATGIKEFVKEYNADMVAVIPHRYKLLENLFHRSISKKMAFHTNIPLLALPDDHSIVPAYFL